VISLKVIKVGDPPPCIDQEVLCRGCFGWRGMLKAAREIPLWQSYPLACPVTGLTVIFIEEAKEDLGEKNG